MPDSKIRQVVQKFLEELSEDIVEERVVAYVIKELHLGRRLPQILKDPYVRNRMSEERVVKVLENPEIISAVEEELDRAFETRDFKFKE
ncbi:MAG: hypothetical protein Q8M92_02020 [Candidatus Subteraquimicrobiales bacterium]|nr:hypothetical protein [Candidatus Subteraquimicrobiales bacterium]